MEALMTHQMQLVSQQLLAATVRLQQANAKWEQAKRLLLLQRIKVRS
jgi:hypothetical protein